MGILDSLGNGIDDIWQYLINDPTKPAGGILQQALNPQAAVAASTKTPLGAPSQAPGAPPPAAPSLLSYFKPHSGILGNSPLAAALSGGLAGLGSSTGYTGLAAVGQGFGGGTRAAQERQMNQMQAIGAGQQYQQGQQQYQLGQGALVNQNVNLAFEAYRMSRMLGRPVSVAELIAHPELLLQSGGQAGQTQPQSQPTSSAAPGSQGGGYQPSAQVPAPAGVGMPPVVGGQPSIGQTPINPQITASMPSSGSVPGYPNQSQSSPTAALAALPTPTGFNAGPPPAGMPNLSAAPTTVAGALQQLHAQQQPSEPQPQSDPNQGTGPAPLGESDPTVERYNQAIADDFAFNDGKGVSGLEAKLADYVNSVPHAAQVATATKSAEDQSLGASSTRLQALREAYAKDHAVSTYADVKPNYQAIVAQYAEGKTAKGGLPSDIDFLNGVIKMMNPNAANLRPGTTEALEEAKGFGSYFQKGYQAIVGGTGLTPDIRETLMNIAKQHMKAYQRAYDTSVKNFRKNASMVAPGVDEGAWRTDMMDQPPAAAVDALKKNPALAEQFEDKYGAGSSLPYVQE